jgi:hypothetical protein
MSKLHEILAVEGSLENQANKCRADLLGTFEKKRHLFEEKRVVFQSFVEGAPEVTESQSSLQSTVWKELTWLRGFSVKALDASYSVAAANTIAIADIVTEDGATLAQGVPATALLELEKRIAEWVDFLKAVPTLDPVRGFVRDTNRGNDVYVAQEVTKTRTKKTKEVIKLAPPTKEHAEQVAMIDVDVPVGKIREMEWSGLITPAEKAELINRAEIVGRAVRQARSRANEVETSRQQIGASLLDYILHK